RGTTSTSSSRRGRIRRRGSPRRPGAPGVRQGVVPGCAASTRGGCHTPMQNRNTLAGAAFTLIALLAGCSSYDPAPEPAPEPAGGTAEEKDPDMTRAAARGSIAVRNDNHPLLRVVFLNNFGRPHAEQVEAAMDADEEFSELLADYAQANRI